MDQQSDEEFNKLIKKVEQHEETIAQLIAIIAETNRRMTELSVSQTKAAISN